MAKKHLKTCLIVLCLTKTLALFAADYEIDNMDDKSLWSTSTSAGSTITFSEDAGVTNDALKIAYSLAADGYVVIERTTNTIDLSDGNAIRFFYRGTGNANNIEIKLTDSDTDVFNYILTGVTATAAWTDTQIPLHAFANTASSTGNKHMNFNRIRNLTFAILPNAGGSGSLLLDEIELYNTAIQTAFDTMVDNFEDADTTPNTLGRVNQMNTDGTINLSLTNDASGGDTALRITYTAGNWAVAFNVDTINFSQFTTQTYLNMDVKGAAGGESIKVKLEQSDGTSSSEIYASNYITVTTAYQTLTIPLADFTGCTDYSRISKITLVAPTGAGSFYVDNVKFSRALVSAASVKTIDAMDVNTTQNSWSSFVDANAVNSVSLVSGYQKSAIQMDYTFNAGTYVGYNRNFYLNLAPGKHLSFYYKESGNNNYLELKIQDLDGTVYRYKGDISTSGNSWTQVSIPYEEFKFHETTSNNDLDLKNIYKLYFAVSEKQVGGGTVWLDSLQYGTVYDFKQTISKNSLLKEVKVTVNPFSPNSDGHLDETEFQFTLDAFSTVRLRIYDLSGSIVYEQTGSFNPGENAMTWNGYNRRGKVVRFGLFYYQLQAVSGDNRKEEFKHIIGVIK